MASLNLNRIAVFYQNDAYGKAGLEGVTRALKKRKLEVVALSTVERNSSEVAAAVAQMRTAKPQAIVLVSAYSSCSAFIKAMLKAGGEQPYFWNISFVGSQSLSKELGKDARGVMVSQVMPAPWEDVHAIVTEYKRDYLNKPGRVAGYVSLEGYIAAKVFVEGLRRAGDRLSRASFTRAMESMHAYDTGGFEVKFSDSNHNGSRYVDLTVMIDDGRFLH